MNRDMEGGAQVRVASRVPADGLLSNRVPFLGFPSGSDGKESICNAGDLDLIPRLGRSPGEGKGYTFQDSTVPGMLSTMYHGGAALGF